MSCALHIGASSHRKLEPPRSLHDVEDAEIIWDTIARRFPNAAPLLCEMETVIERAEDLLQQLRTPCAQGTDTSSSFHTPDSRESNATISMVSDIESFAEETNVPERFDANEEEVETRIARRDVRVRQANSESQHRSEQSIQREVEYPGKEYHLEPPSFGLDEVVQHLETSSTNKRRSSRGESDANVTDSGDKRIGASSEERLTELMEEKSSLEGWTKVADNALREWHGGTDNVEVSNNSETRSSVDANIDNCWLIIDNGGKRDKSARKLCDTNGVTKNDLSGDVAESSTITANHRSPLAILEGYAKRCEVPIKYECKPKSNLCVINGDLCGFRAMSCAGTQDLAKDELAAKILRMVAERQMDGSKLSSSICGLSDLSREEILEIIAFHKGELKNASQKVYKFCLEKGEPTPKYSVRNSRTNQGLVYVAQCTALGYVGTGQGLRKDSAKIAAAESLYQKYTREAEQRPT